jgi:DNA-binding transcriptional MocR family regulator
MSMNLPPQFDDPELSRRMWRAVAEVEAEQGASLLLRYQDAAGVAADRAAGAEWLKDRLPQASAERVLVSAGAQPALVAILSTLARPGEAICAEALTYPGLRSAAAHLGVSVLGAAMDEEGIIPAAFDQVCRDHGPKALYCTPTLQNPTTATMSAPRRRAIVDIARRRRVPILEDDAYGGLPRAPLPPLAALAPELTYHVSGLAKEVSPALRIAYVVAPDAAARSRVAAGLRAISGMASPLTAALASRWIRTGLAARALAAIRGETEARRSLAARIIGAGAAHPADAFHLWLELPRPWTRAAFQAALLRREVSVVPSDAFAVTAWAPEAVRIGLGAAAGRAETERALEAVAEVLAEAPAAAGGVI